MKLFTHDTNRSETELILDVETSMVRALLVRYRHGTAPVVIARSSRAFRLLPQTDFHQTWREFRNAVTAVVGDLVAKSGIRPERAQCILSAPWYAAQVRTVEMFHETSFRVSRELISRTSEEEEKQFQQYVRGVFVNYEHETPIVERQLIRMRLNGYNVRHVENQDVTHAELTFYYSVCSDAIHSLMGEMLRDYMMPEKIRFLTFPFAAFHVLKDLLNTEEGFLFVRIGGEATEVFSASDGTMQDIASFLIGEHEVVRNTAGVLHTSAESAASQLRQYQARQLHERVAVQIKTVVDCVSREWFGQLKNFLSIASRRCPAPQTVFFSADGLLTDTARAFLQQDYARHFTMLGKPFDVKIFSPRAIQQFVVFPQDFYPGDGTLLFGVLASSYFSPHAYADFSTIVS